jgi:hypothetical protein
MNQLPADLARRLLYIMHRGFVQVRNLALAQGTEQVADLADAMEILPSFMNSWEDGHLEMIRYILRAYQEKYPGGGYDYLAELDKYELAERF